MVVKVIVWWPHGSNIGHAAMEVNGGSPLGRMYLSSWPGSIAGTIGLIGPGQINEFEDDMRAEHGEQPSFVYLSKLNETNIKGAMMVANKLPVWGMLAANCAHHVGWCPRQGFATGTLRGLAGGMLDGALQTTQGGNAIRELQINSPWGLYVYAQSLRPLYG